MLKTRVITAIIVAPLALAALLLLEPTPFRAFIAIVLGVWLRGRGWATDVFCAA
jgi:CDP-diglyceride synthetase